MVKYLIYPIIKCSLDQVPLGSVHNKFKFLCDCCLLGLEVTNTPGKEIVLDAHPIYFAVRNLTL